MKVKYAKANGNLFIACTGYPSCKNTLGLPKGLSNITMTDKNCPRCMQKGVKAKLFNIEFDANLVNESMGEVLPHDDNTSGTFCVMPDCDK